jgi:tRNA(fMet)-specific endonuclease VapC
MSLHAFDTDSVTLLLHGHAEISRNAAIYSPADLALTIVTVEEMLTGWYSQIRKAKNDEQRIRAYAALQQAVEFCSHARILPMNQSAVSRFNELRGKKIRIGTNDLKIASIALAHDAVLVTRNLRDYKRVPGLEFVDWSKPAG